MARFNPRTRTLEEALAWRERLIKDHEKKLAIEDRTEWRCNLNRIRQWTDEDAMREIARSVQAHYDERLKRWHKFTESRARYRDCSFDNFVVTTPEQQAALDRVRRFAENLEEHIASGVNVVFHGPVGTGKDHLLHALMRVVYMELAEKIDIHYHRGVDLSARAKQHRGMVTDRGWFDDAPPLGILAISDPVLSGESAKFYELQRLFELIDFQYSNKWPTWITVNASSRDELNTMLTPAVADRLRDGAFAVHCNWASYRKAGSF